MTAILDLPDVRARALRWSVEDYERLAELGVLERRAELIRGVIVEKMPKSPLHFTLTQRIVAWFRKNVGKGCVVRQEGPLRLLNDSEPEPDIALVRGTDDDFSTAHPTTAALVVEVAVSSVALDRENASLYAEAGVAEYWIVLGQERAVEVYRAPAAGVYTDRHVYQAGETLVCEALPDVQAPLAEWFA